MRVELLGPVRVVVEGEAVELGGPRNRALVARLALSNERPVSAAALIDDLWDDPPADATNALQSIVSRTRRRLPEGALTSGPAGYTLHAESVDAADFEADVRGGRAGSALRRWKGQPLAGLTDEPPFVRPAELRLCALHDEAMEADLLRRAQHSPDDALLAELSGLVDAAPHRERLHLARLTALTGLARTAEALDEYETLRQRLADDLGVDPSLDLQAWHLAALRGDAGTTAATGSALPTSLTELIGRDDALDDTARALTRARLVTIVGPGGTGKTRLAIEAARRQQHDTADAVWLAELATVVDPEDVAGTLLAVFGSEAVAPDRRRPDTRDDRTRLLDLAPGLTGLLVLDNCEHLVDAAASVAELLLSRAPRLTILATGRAPLRIVGEAVYQLPSLPVPPTGTDAVTASRSPSVVLFADRATLADPEFVLDGSTVAAVIEICTRLDGQPLALELAAARMHTMDVDTIAERLADRFSLLVGNRGSVPRHRTLSALVEWSWELLTEEERNVAELVSVFPAPFTAEAADHLTGPDTGIDTDDLLDRLADKSLLVPLRGRPRRFRMLETIREFAAARLDDADRRDAARTALADWALWLSGRLEPDLRGPAQVGTLAKLNAENGNLMAALRFAIESADRSRTAQLARNLSLYWTMQDRSFESLMVADEMSALPGRAAPAAEIACELLSLFNHWTDREYIYGVRDRILAAWDEGTDDPIAVVAVATIEWLGMLGDHAPPQVTDPWTQAVCLLVQVNILENDGKALEAESLLAKALPLCEESGDAWLLAVALGEHAQLAAWRGQPAVASAQLRRSADLHETLGAGSEARLARLRADITDVEADPSRAREIRDNFDSRPGGDTVRDIVASVSLAALDLVVGDFACAARRVKERLPEVEEMSQRMPQFGAMVHTIGVRAFAGLAAVEQSAAHAQSAIELAWSSNDRPIMAMVCAAIAGLGSDEDGARLIGASDALRGLPDLSDAQTIADTQRLREQLATSYEALYDEGHHLGVDEAMALARSVVDQTLRR